VTRAARNGRCDRVDRRIVESGVEGQRKDLGAHASGDGTVGRLATESRLMRDRNGVVDQGFDTGASQVRLKPIADPAAHGEEMVDMTGVEFRRHRDCIAAREGRAIAAAERPTTLCPATKEG
jgi:hypothetical protein